MDIPYPETVSIPRGDSYTLEIGPVRDRATELPVDLLAEYDACEVGIGPMPAGTGDDPIALRTITLGSGVTFLTGGIIRVELTTADTALPPGTYALQVRPRLGTAVAHTLKPTHRVRITATPL